MHHWVWQVWQAPTRPPAHPPVSSGGLASWMWKRRRERHNPLSSCCRNPPPLCSSSSSASSFPYSSPAALSAGSCSPAFNAQWLVVVCSCLLLSLSLPAVQRPSIAGCPLSLFGPDAVIVAVVVAGGCAGLLADTGHEAMTEDQLVLHH